MFGFQKTPKTPAGPPALTSQELLFKVALLQAQIIDLQETVLYLAKSLRMQIDRLDYNTKMLDENMHRLAAMTIRPPKDLLNGHEEAN